MARARRVTARRPLAVLIAAASLVLPAAPAARAQAPTATSVADSAITNAEAAARQWLALMAAHEYLASWAESSPYFRQQIARDDWRATAERLDRQFQRVERRRLTSAQWYHDQPPLPPRQWVVLRWVTHLPDQREVYETMSMLLAADGQWQTATYLLFPDVDGEPIIAPEHGGAGLRPSGPPRPPSTVAWPGGH
jgi:Protein of unknown function (DUF4019)